MLPLGKAVIMQGDKVQTQGVVVQVVPAHVIAGISNSAINKKIFLIIILPRLRYRTMHS